METNTDKDFWNVLGNKIISVVDWIAPLCAFENSEKCHKPGFIKNKINNKKDYKISQKNQKS
jgi:hypothetical protein